MPYETLLDVIRDPLFAATDLALRRGQHISADSDPFAYEFLDTTREHVEEFYAAYGVQLVCGREGYFYLVPDRNLVPAPLGSRHLSMLEMLAGQALALMRLEPKWLATGGRIPDAKVLELLENLLGPEALLKLSRPRRRGRDDEQDAKKLRENLGTALNTLERLGFLRREGRGENATVTPLKSIMRFADPVRSSEPLDEALARLIREGEIEDIAEEAPDAAEAGDR